MTGVFAGRTRLVAGAALLLCGIALLLGASSARSQGGETVFAIDVDAAAPGVQTTRTAGVGETLHIRIALQSITGDAWGSYQVTMEFDPSEIEITGLPENWGDAPTDSLGGNLAQFSSGPLCDPSPSSAAVATSPGSPAGTPANSVTVTCAERNFDEVTSMSSGDILDVVARCIAPGDADLGLSTAENTFLLDTRSLQVGDPVTHSDRRDGATITCSGETLTATPGGSAPTTTPGVQTTVTPRTPNPNAGTPASGTPDTSLGSSDDDDGDDDDDDSSTLPILIGIIVAVVVLGAGGAALMLRRRP